MASDFDEYISIRKPKRLFQIMSNLSNDALSILQEPIKMEDDIVFNKLAST